MTIDNPALLDGVRIVTLALNIPGPVAVQRLVGMGAAAFKVEPPTGDPLARYAPGWYAELIAEQEVQRLDLKTASALEAVERALQAAHLVITSSRPSTLASHGLSRRSLNHRFPNLSQVAIVGYPAPDDDVPAHDLNCEAKLGLLTPPALPRTLIADLAAAERTVSAALALLLQRQRGRGPGFAQVSLWEAASAFCAPVRWGLTAPGARLGGGLPGYGLYRARDGWIAVAALEEHFLDTLTGELGLEIDTREAYERIFPTRSAREWEVWARDRSLPISAVSQHAEVSAPV